MVAVGSKVLETEQYFSKDSWAALSYFLLNRK
jgi:hypothetical protein